MMNPLSRLASTCVRIAGLVAAVLLTGVSGPVLAQEGPVLAQEEWRIAAVVDEQMISFMDLENRIRLVMFATGLPPSAENMNRLMPQILQVMVDEALQRQEAKARNVTTSSAEVERALSEMEQRNNLPPGGLDEFLASKGVEKRALESQVESSIAWAKLVDRRLRPQVEIGDEEIDEALRRVAENQSQPQLLVSEIFLAVDDTAAESRVRESALRIAQQIRAGASFEALARALSQNATAASGGDLGWLAEGQFEEEFTRALATMQPGQVAGPIRTPEGYHLILLRNRRLPGGASPNQVTVDLRQIGLQLPPSPTEENMRAALAAAASIRNSATDCATLEAAPLPGNAQLTRIGRMRVSDLAAPIQPAIMALDANEISPPMRSRQGIVLFMVCEREAPEIELPAREDVRRRLELEKLDLLARRYMRDLRRAAFVDLRI